MKRNRKYSTITDTVRETLDGISKVTDNKETIRKFNRLQFEEAKVYRPRDIKNLREKKLNMSQAVFAYTCNVKLSTLQKWESGVNKPTPPVNRLFQLIEKDALSLIENKK